MHEWWWHILMMMMIPNIIPFYVEIYTLHRLTLEGDASWQIRIQCKVNKQAEAARSLMQ